MNSKIENLISKLFNDESNEQIVMLRKGEIVISSENAKKFPSIPNLQNIMINIK